MYRTLFKGVVATLIIMLGIVPAADAQLLGQMSTASVEEVGARKLGGYVGLTGDFVSLTGQFRYGIASSFDMGAKAAFVDFNDNGGSSVAFNADAKIQLLDVFLHDPVDLSMGPDVTYFKASDVTNWYFGGFVMISKEFYLGNGKPLSPYARLGVRMHRLSSSLGDSDDLDAGFAGGVEYSISGYTQIYGEIVIEDVGTGMYVGAQYQLP
jgi:hypothetical protein